MISTRSQFTVIFNRGEKNLLKEHLTYFDKVTHNYPLALYLSKPYRIDMQGPRNSS